MRHIEGRGETELCRAAELADAHALMVDSWGRGGREGGKSVRPSPDGNFSRPVVSLGGMDLLILGMQVLLKARPYS